MRAAFKALAITLALALGCQSALAGWYSARGSAAIVDDDVAAARRMAIDDALRNASLQAGANVSIEQSIQNGTLLDEKMQIVSKSPIRRMIVVEEQENGKMVTVLVKALIDDSSSSDCYAGNIKKIILPFIIRYKDTEASMSAADMPDFADFLTDQLYTGVAQSPALTLLPPDRARLLFNQSSSGPNYNLQRTLDSISRRTQAQYIIVGTVSSVAVSEVGSNAVTKYIYTPTRTLRFSVQVYDVYSGSMVLNKDYAGDAEWTLKGERFSLRSDRFASSDYGQRINQLTKYAIADIVTQLRCQIPRARVVNIADDSIRINLGSNSNLKVGMRFHLIHRSDFQDRHSMTYYQNSETQKLYKVVDVSPNSAVLVPVDITNQLINVQLDDIVELNV